MFTDLQSTLTDMLCKTLSACPLTLNKGLCTGLVRVVVNLTCAFEAFNVSVRLGCSVLSLSCEKHHFRSSLQHMNETLSWPVSNLLVVANICVSWHEHMSQC